MSRGRCGVGHSTESRWGSVQGGDGGDPLLRVVDDKVVDQRFLINGGDHPRQGGEDGQHGSPEGVPGPVFDKTEQPQQRAQCRRAGRFGPLLDFLGLGQAENPGPPLFAFRPGVEQFLRRVGPGDGVVPDSQPAIGGEGFDLPQTAAVADLQVGHLCQRDRLCRFEGPAPFRWFERPQQSPAGQQQHARAVPLVGAEVVAEHGGDRLVGLQALRQPLLLCGGKAVPIVGRVTQGNDS